MAEAPVPTLVLGSRKSELAMVQTRHVKALLEARFPGLTVEIRTSATEGDLKLDRPLAELAASSPGLFTKELEVWLAGGACDAAVHSLKDVPTQLPAGLGIAAISAREDPRDVLILSPKHAAAGVKGLADLPAGAVVGTSSLRRRALLGRLRPDLECISVRGNLQTRLRKLDEPASEGPGAPRYDALLLAAAGVRRLGWWDRVAEALGPAVDADGMAPEGAGGGAASFLWGVGQGALAVEVRAADVDVAAMVRAAVGSAAAEAACTAERAMLRGLLGGCQVPIAACSAAMPAEGGALRLSLSGVVASPDGSTVVEAEAPPTDVPVDPAAVQAAGDAAWERLRAGAPATSAPDAVASSPAFAASGCHLAAEADPAIAAAAAAGAALAADLVARGASALLGPEGAEPRPITFGSA